MTDLTKAYLFILLLAAPVGAYLIIALRQTMIARRQASKSRQWVMEYHHGATGMLIAAALGTFIAVFGSIIYAIVR